MSAPKTDIEKQERRHKGPLVGIAVAVSVALLLLLALTAYVVMTGNEPDGADTLIDGRTGEEVPAD
ncbi:hypothetical protein [Anianabacter salinae]|uniref:hypothetical protein n=1 Tax=Anianabacter salinae TaxID=2851023 RepID=UPI00225E0138|nr:hypothetical protein [Anianabacter salinae]MBV0914055.1 hypothetical protein [Anianabacter salinae]